MKSLERGYLWTPGLDTAIEQSQFTSCLCCTRHALSHGNIHLYTHRIFEKDKLNFLIVIYAYSKWLEVIPMSSTTSGKTIEALSTLFACYGIPKEVISDNGPQLAAEEFSQFMRMNDVQVHSCSTIAPTECQSGLVAPAGFWPREFPACIYAFLKK